MATQTRPEIRQILIRLRRWIRRYVLLQGLALSVALACLLFWLTFGLDIVYFQASRLELPGWFRVACTLGMAGLLAGVSLSWLIGKWLRRMKPADLALTLERRFPVLNDRLITAVELEGRPDSPMQASLLDRTVDEAVERLSAIRLEEAINPAPLRRMLIAAGVLLASVLALGIANAQGMERWYQAFILGRDNYWEPFRRNALRVRIVAQPGDRVREFDARGVYRHPRGADLQLVASVPENAEAPERVDLTFVSFGGGGQQRGRVMMSRLGESEFRQTLSRVMDDHQLWLRGGDYISRRPLRVQVVDPPRIDSLQLHCDYPSYTGLDELEDRVVRVAGTQVALPMETKFELSAAVNKPLLKVHVRTSRWELSFGFEPAGNGQVPTATRLNLLTPQQELERTLELSASPAALFDAERKRFTLPLLVTASAAQKARELSSEREFPLPIPPDETLQILLEDEDLIYSPEPAALTVNGIVDQPPAVDARRTGVGPWITRMANIPVEGRLTDDYGVVAAWFAYRVNGQGDEHRVEFTKSPSGQKEFVLRQSPERAAELFNLIPLKLEDGQTLTLSPYAQDGDDLNGPHVAHGEVLSFKIVSKEDLLGKLFDREVTLRARFEQIRAEVADLRSSFDQTRQQVRAIEDKSAGNAPAPAVVQAYVDRALHQIRKNHTESRSIEVSFRDLREEMVNNRVDTGELLERIERRVIEPMSLLNSADFLDADRRLGTFRLAMERQTGLSAAAEETVPALDHLIAQMDAILAEMRDRGTFNELIQSLQDIIQREKQLLEQTEDKRIEGDFFTPQK